MSDYLSNLLKKEMPNWGNSYLHHHNTLPPIYLLLLLPLLLLLLFSSPPSFSFALS